MTTAEPPISASPTPEPERRPELTGRTALTVRGRLRLWWIVARCRLRVRPVPATTPADPSAALVPGELMVAAPVDAPVDAVLNLVSNSFGRFVTARPEMLRADEPVERDAELRPDERESLVERDDGRRLLPLRFRYARMRCTPGAERYVTAGIQIAARHLSAGSFRASAVQAMRVVQNAAMTPSGPIELAPDFLAEVDSARPGHHRGSDVRVLIVDTMVPAQLADPGTVMPDGHGTLMHEIVTTVAPQATVQAVAIGAQYEASSWSLLRAVTENRDTDVMVASLSLDAGDDDPRADDRREFMSRWLEDVTRSPLRPIVVLPTGNARRGGEEIDRIAIPARFAAALTIGALDPAGRRASGSRYGSKDGPAAFDWWVAPGGAFDVDEVVTPCASMGGVPQAGTSVANAVAGGLIACLIDELRWSAGIVRDEAADEAAVHARMIEALPAGSSQRTELERILHDAALAARGAVTRWTVLAALQNRTAPLAGEPAREVGLGRLQI